MISKNGYLNSTADEGTRYLPALNIFGAFWTIAGGLAWAISFGVMAPKQDASFVFKLFLNNSGYTSSVWVFIMSFYTPMYGLYGTDGMMHLVEEMRDASKQAPVSSASMLMSFLLNNQKRVMVWSMIFCSVTSWLGAILMMWCAGDWETYMEGMVATSPFFWAKFFY
jgi:choline transport protein